MAKINGLGAGDGVISDYFRNLDLSSVNSLWELIFLFFYTMPILDNIATILGNIVTTLSGLMTTMGIFFDGLG